MHVAICSSLMIVCVCFPQKSKASRSKSSSTQEQLDEKDERIRHLEAVNITLKQTNDDLNEEVAELRRQFEEQSEKVKLTTFIFQTGQTNCIIVLFSFIKVIDHQS